MPTESASPTSHELVVLGGGISGLAAAHFARRWGLRDVVVVEAANRVGGKIQTEWIDGWCCEWGPQGFLDNVPETLELAGDLGLVPQLVRADDAAGARFIVRRGRLRELPLSPPAFFASGVLSWPGKLRLLFEPFQGPGAEDESVLEFASRRIGREAAEILVDAMVTGVYAGDPAALSLPATFPKMREMEAIYGSLVKAMIARKRAGTGGGPAGPGGTLTTFARGMQQLPDALATSLGAIVRLGSAVSRVERAEDGLLRIVLDSGDVLRSRRVACALPPTAAADVLEGLVGPPAIAALRAIPSVRIAVVMTGYLAPTPFRHTTTGFGFLVPGRERRKILGTIFCDSTFPSQAPSGATLLRTLLGGWRNGAIVDLPDDDLVTVVRSELDATLGGDRAPDLTRIIRHDYGIPQYTLGHLARLAAIDHAVAEIPGLTVLGNGYRGVAVNACIAEAKRLTAALIDQPGPA